MPVNRTASLPQLLLWVAALLGVVGCVPSLAEPGSGTVSTTQDAPIRVTCTTGMVADLVAHVGGDRVEVVALMGEGVDPHLYKASTGDIFLLNRADLIVYNGLHLEGKMGDLFERLGHRKPTLAVAEGIDKTRLLRTAGAVDPHLWFDVALWSQGLDGIADTLAQLDPNHANDYRRNAETYRAKLLELDSWCRARLATIPPSRRVLVTAHDAFHYFGRSYDLEVRAIQGMSTESEAGVLEINQLVDFLTRRRIKAVFVESSINDRNIRALVEGCAARGHVVAIGGELFSDAMGRPGTPEGTYVGMVQHNVNTIVNSLK